MCVGREVKVYIYIYMHIHLYAAVLACVCTCGGQKSMSDIFPFLSQLSDIRSLTKHRTQFQTDWILMSS